MEDQDLDVPRLFGEAVARTFRISKGSRQVGFGYPAPPMPNDRQTYRMRAPGSGREALAQVEADGVYVDRESGEELRPVTRTLPLAPSDSGAPSGSREPARVPALRSADRARRQRLPLLRAAPAGAGRRYVISPTARRAGPAAGALLACLALLGGVAIPGCGGDDEGRRLPRPRRRSSRRRLRGRRAPPAGRATSSTRPPTTAMSTPTTAPSRRRRRATRSRVGAPPRWTRRRTTSRPRRARPRRSSRSTATRIRTPAGSGRRGG